MDIIRIIPSSLARVNQLRYYSSMGVALLVSFGISYFFSVTNLFILPLTALFVMQTSIGNVLYQGLLRFFFLLFFITCLLILLSSQALFYSLAHDIGLGACTGIVINLLAFPRQVDIEFRAAVVPVIQAYEKYFLALMDSLLRNDESAIYSTKMTVEQCMLKLPSWVYQRGFDSGLQKGHLFFLGKVENIADILFAMNHLIRNPFDMHLINEMQGVLTPCIDHVQQFFSFILARMNLDPEVKTITDFAEDLDALESKFQQLAPFELELIDIKQDYVYFAELIYYMHELRYDLLKLIQALRVPRKN